MGVRILSIDGGGDTCLYCSTTNWAFGPVADEETLERFIGWAKEVDLRSVTPIYLEALWHRFIKEQDETMPVV